MSEILRFIDNNYLYMVTGITIVLCVLVFVFIQRYICLLYTSDAADEEDSVDLCGRRIIKKKKNKRDGIGRHVCYELGNCYV